MSVSGQILQDLLGAYEWPLRIDDPLLLVELVDQALKE
jgi:hypothetical protein